MVISPDVRLGAIAASGRCGLPDDFLDEFFPPLAAAGYSPEMQLHSQQQQFQHTFNEWDAYLNNLWTSCGDNGVVGLLGHNQTQPMGTVTDTISGKLHQQHHNDLECDVTIIKMKQEEPSTMTMNPKKNFQDTTPLKHRYGISTLQQIKTEAEAIATNSPTNGVEIGGNRCAEKQLTPPASTHLSPAEQEPQPELDIFINNVVCSFSTKCNLNLREIALNGANVEFRRQNCMLTMKLRRPYTTASIWSSGHVTCTGATSERQAKIAARRYARCLEKLGFGVRFRNYRVVNVLGTCTMPWAIKIVNFSERYRKEASYEPELHPGVTYRLSYPTATLKIFSTGSITVTAANVANVQAAIEHIFPRLLEFRRQRTAEEIELLRSKQMEIVDGTLSPLKETTNDQSSSPPGCWEESITDLTHCPSLALSPSMPEATYSSPVQSISSPLKRTKNDCTLSLLNSQIPSVSEQQTYLLSDSLTHSRFRKYITVPTSFLSAAKETTIDCIHSSPKEMAQMHSTKPASIRSSSSLLSNIFDIKNVKNTATGTNEPVALFSRDDRRALKSDSNDVIIFSNGSAVYEGANGDIITISKLDDPSDLIEGPNDEGFRDS